MKAKNHYTIKFVADRTGLKPHLIRAWESRYRAVAPKRTQTNRRLYCQDDIRRLKMLKLAIDAGQQISHIARMNSSELRELLGEMDSTPSPSPTYPLDTDCDQTVADRYQRHCLKAVIDLEQDRLTNLLSDAAVHLTRRQWVESLIVPLFKEIGDLWQSGNLKIVSEHMASNCARMIMWDLLRSVEISSGAPKIVLGTPVGQWHEMGSLAAALAAVETGWRPIYLGVNLPSEELAAAAAHFGAKCIGLGIRCCADDTCLGPELVKLRRFIGPEPRILVGGLHGIKWESLMQQINSSPIESWQDVTTALTYFSVTIQ